MINEGVFRRTPGRVMRSRRVRPWVHLAGQLVTIAGTVYGLMLVAGLGWALTVGAGMAWIVLSMLWLSTPVPGAPRARTRPASPLDGE
jgi:hypothetical protein